MGPRSKSELAEVLPEIGRAVLVTGGFGAALTLSTLALLLMSTTLVLALVLRPLQSLGSIGVLAVISLCEILIFGLATGALVLGLGLFLKGPVDALRPFFVIQHPWGFVRKVWIISRLTSEEFVEQNCGYLQIDAG